VLRRHPDVARYGATLLMMSARTSGQLLAAAAFAESDVPLRRRILAMTTPPRTLSAVGLLGVLAIGIVLLTGALRVPVPEVAWALPLQVRAGVEAASPADALPPSRIIADPGRRWMGFFLESREIETREIAPANRWFPLSSDGRNGFFPVPYFPGASWGVVSPLPPEVELRQLTRIPRILNAGEILRAIGEAYPPRLRERGLGGTVGVQFLVEPAGVVVERRVGQISAYRDLDEAALAVARVYRFSGAELDGRPVPVWVSHAIDFRVD
jgi:TonB family protein